MGINQVRRESDCLVVMVSVDCCLVVQKLLTPTCLLFLFSSFSSFSSFSCVSHRSLTYARVCAQYDEGGFFYDMRANGTTLPSLTKINKLQTKWEDYNQQHRGQSSMYTDSQMQVNLNKKNF